MVAEVRPDYPGAYAAKTAPAQMLDIGSPETIRTWIRGNQVDAGVKIQRVARMTAESIANRLPALDAPAKMTPHSPVRRLAQNQAEFSTPAVLTHRHEVDARDRYRLLDLGIQRRWEE